MGVRDEPALIYTALSAGYAAAIASGWVPQDWVQWLFAGVIATGGILVRQNVYSQTTYEMSTPHKR